MRPDPKPERKAKKRYGGFKKKSLPLKASPVKKTDIILDVSVKLVDILFSRYIKKKFGQNCYTCNNKEGFPIECGHFIKRRYWALRWDPNNARPQCTFCNHNLDGNEAVFESKLRKEIGNPKVETMLMAKNQFCKKPNKGELLKIINDIKTWK